MDQNLFNKKFGTKTDLGWVWQFKRNCSITPFQLMGIFTLLGLVSLVIGVTFFVMGAPLIFPFSCVEIIVLAVAFFYNAAHANDFERLRIEGNKVILELKDGKRESTVELQRSFTKMTSLPHMKNLLLLSQGAREVYFGQHVHQSFREPLLREIRLQI
jgi:uncharacterized membrane protein